PLADDESFAPQPQDGEERLLAGVQDRGRGLRRTPAEFRGRGARRKAAGARPGRGGTATSTSGARSTTSNGRRPLIARWAATSASSLRRGSSRAPTRATRPAKRRRCPSGPA